MERAEVHERIVTLIAEAAVVPREDVENPRTNLREDLGMDSMEYIELITVLERDLGQHVEHEQLSYVRTVADVVDLVCDLIAKRDAPQASL